MVEVVIIGAGNVAQHLFDAFEKSKETTVVQVYNQNSDNLSYFKNKTLTTSNLNDLYKAKVYIVSVKDDAIEEVTKKLPKEAFVVHTSGSVPMFEGRKRSGVFYPLQTFSKHKKVDFKSIPICLEASTEEDLNLLKKIAQSISEKVYEISSTQREKLHLAAVFASNFSNHMYTISKEICNDNNVPFDVLSALIQETAAKAVQGNPLEAQTGPAIRNDKKTIDKHLKQLKTGNSKEIYKLLTQSIQQYGKKL